MKFIAAICKYKTLLDSRRCFQFTSGGRFDAIAWQRLAALLGKEPRCRLGTYRWVWTSWATTSNSTLVAELIEPYLVLYFPGLALALGGHRLLAAAHWPCPGLALAFDLALCWPCAGLASCASDLALGRPRCIQVLSRP